MFKILIVDDFATNGIFIKNALGSKKYETKTLISGMQALNYLDNGNTVDLILLDVNMPEMDGIETLKRIRSRERFKTVPIIFVTGAPDRYRVLQGFKNGIDDVIAKPVEPDFLNMRVDRALRGETPVQQYKKRNGENIDELAILYRKLAGEFARSFKPIPGGLHLDSYNSITDYENGEKDNDSDEDDFGIDFSGIIDKNLW